MITSCISFRLSICNQPIVTDTCVKNCYIASNDDFQRYFLMCNTLPCPNFIDLLIFFSDRFIKTHDNEKKTSFTDNECSNIVLSGLDRNEDSAILFIQNNCFVLQFVNKSAIQIFKVVAFGVTQFHNSNNNQRQLNHI